MARQDFFAPKESRSRRVKSRRVADRNPSDLGFLEAGNLTPLRCVRSCGVAGSSRGVSSAEIALMLLDALAQHIGRTGREVLTLSAITLCLPAKRVDEMLETVVLTTSESKRRVRNYSLGMRQRLGLTNAMLGDPSVLILDERANGLDPAGIRWMRGLLSQYAARGGTVLLTSHLVNEVELVADELVITGHGQIVAQGSPKPSSRGAADR